MAEQVSNKAIVALVVVTILVTVAGTLLFLNGADDQIKSPFRYDNENGQVELRVAEDPIVVEGPKGDVALQIL